MSDAEDLSSFFDPVDARPAQADIEQKTEVEKVFIETLEKKLRLAQLIKRIFIDTVDGRELLEEMRVSLCENPALDWGIDPLAMVVKSFVAEGQKSVYLYLKDNINSVDKLKQELENATRK